MAFKLVYLNFGLIKVWNYIDAKIMSTKLWIERRRHAIQIGPGFLSIILGVNLWTWPDRHANKEICSYSRGLVAKLHESDLGKCFSLQFSMRLFAMCNVFFKGILLVCPHSYFELIISSCILKGKDIAENQKPVCQC